MWVQQQVAKADPGANLASTKSHLCHKSWPKGSDFPVWSKTNVQEDLSSQHQSQLMAPMSLVHGLQVI